MLFVTKDLRGESEELTHGNILRDDVVTLISFLLEIIAGSGCNQW
jgi:hypothetical protein